MELIFWYQYRGKLQDRYQRKLYLTKNYQRVLRSRTHIQKTSLKQTKFLIYYYCQILNINLVIIAKHEKGQDNNEAIYLDLNRFNMFNNLL